MKSSPSIWQHVVSVKSTVNFVAFLENMHFTFMDWRSKGGGVRVSKNLLD